MAGGVVYFKSFLWLAALGGLGYGLLLLTAPSEQKIAKIKELSKSTNLSDEEKRKILFMRKLRAAAGDPPSVETSEKSGKGDK